MTSCNSLYYRELQHRIFKVYGVAHHPSNATRTLIVPVFFGTTSLAAALLEPGAPVLTLSVSTGVLTVAATWEAAADADWAGFELIPSEVKATACPCSTTNGT